MARHEATEKISTVPRLLCDALGASRSFCQGQWLQILNDVLQVSPYQDQHIIKDIATKACLYNGIEFIERDFSKAYRAGQEMAKSDDLYRQKYCGCIYSLNESHPKFKAKLLKEFGLQEKDLPVREA